MEKLEESLKLVAGRTSLLGLFHCSLPQVGTAPPYSSYNLDKNEPFRMRVSRCCFFNNLPTGNNHIAAGYAGCHVSETCASLSHLITSEKEENSR